MGPQPLRFRANFRLLCKLLTVLLCKLIHTHIHMYMYKYIYIYIYIYIFSEREHTQLYIYMYICIYIYICILLLYKHEPPQKNPQPHALERVKAGAAWHFRGYEGKSMSGLSRGSKLRGNVVRFGLRGSKLRILASQNPQEVEVVGPLKP